MKRIIYITAFTFFGLIIAALLHGIIELSLLAMITDDFDRWGNSYLWQNWPMLHTVVGGAGWLAGLGLGVWGGFRYWRILYVEQKRGKLHF